jgi:hypothetical protein
MREQEQLNRDVDTLASTTETGLMEFVQREVTDLDRINRHSDESTLLLRCRSIALKNVQKEIESKLSRPDTTSPQRCSPSRDDGSQITHYPRPIP